MKVSGGHARAWLGAVCGPSRRLRDDERGQVAFAMVVCFLGIFAIAALALDAGLWFFDHRNAQNQVDAAALAGAQALPSTYAVATASGGAVDRAKDYLKRNGVPAAMADAATVSQGSAGTPPVCTTMAAGTVQIQLTDLSTPADGTIDTIRVCVRRKSVVVFGALSSLATPKVSAGATATIPLKTLPYILMVLDDKNEYGALEMSGNSHVVVAGQGGTYVRSLATGNANTGAPNGCDKGEAICVETGSSITSSINDVTSPHYDCAGTCNIVPSVSQPYVEDPFINLAPPGLPTAKLTCASYQANPVTLIASISPGCWDKLDVPNGGDWTMSPGNYVFKNGITVGGTTALPGKLTMTAGAYSVYIATGIQVQAGGTFKMSPGFYQIGNNGIDVLKATSTATRGTLELQGGGGSGGSTAGVYVWAFTSGDAIILQGGTSASLPGGKMTSNGAEVLMYVTCDGYTSSNREPCGTGTNCNSYPGTCTREKRDRVMETFPFSNLDLVGLSTFEHIVMWTDRRLDEESHTAWSGGVQTITGNVYQRHTEIQHGGNGDVFNLRGQVVVWSISLLDGQQYNITYDVGIVPKGNGPPGLIE